MGGVGYGLITIVVFGSSDVVVENPVLASHALAEVCWLVEAFCTVRDALSDIEKGLPARRLRGCDLLEEV